MIVLNKPAGLAVHPATSHAPGTKTLIDPLLAEYPELAQVGEDPSRPGIVHRLDADTSGVMVIARTQDAFDKLKTAFRDRTVQKSYTLLAYGTPDWAEKKVDLSIARTSSGKFGARHPNDVAKLPKQKRDSFREASTEFSVKKKYRQYTLMKARPRTGRTHQIRVHAKALGFPIVGDKLYAGKKQSNQTRSKLGLERQFLHASKLVFEHPRSGKLIHFEAPLSNDLQHVLDQL